MLINKTYNTITIYTFVIVFFNQGSTFISNIIIARTLGKENYGQYILFFNAISMVVAFSGLGMNSFSNRFISEYKENIKRISELLSYSIKMLLYVNTSLCIFLLLFNNKIIFYFGQNLQDICIFGVGIMIIFVNVFNSWLTGVFYGYHLHKYLAIINVFYGTIYVLSCLLGSFYNGILGVLIAILLSNIIYLILVGYFFYITILNDGVKIFDVNIKNEKKITNTWLIPSILNGLTAMPSLWCAQLFLSKENGFVELAYYNAAFSLASIILIIPAILNNVGLTVLSSIMGKNDINSYERAFWLNLKILTITIILICLVTAIIGKFLLSFYGRDYTNAYSALIILLIAVIFETVSNGFYQIYQSKSKMWLTFFTISIPRDLSIIFLAFFMTDLGALGLSLVYLIARIIAFISILIGCYKFGLFKSNTSLIW